MPSGTGFAKWLGNDRHPNYLGNRKYALAEMTWRKIMERPSIVTLYRKGVPQPAQTVRIEDSNYGNFTAVFPGGEVGSQQMIMIGVKDHPTVADFNVKRGDTFVYDEKDFEVADTITTNLGWTQAFLEVAS